MDLIRPGDQRWPTNRPAMRCRHCREPIQADQSFAIEDWNRPWVAFHESCIREVLGSSSASVVDREVKKIKDAIRSWEQNTRYVAISELKRVIKGQEAQRDDALANIARLEVEVAALEAPSSKRLGKIPKSNARRQQHRG